MQYACLYFYHINCLAVRVDLDYVNVHERYEEREISKLETTAGIKIIEHFLMSRERGRQKKRERNKKWKKATQRKSDRSRAGHGVIQVGR